jgi:hypothetical protein
MRWGMPPPPRRRSPSSSAPRAAALELNAGVRDLRSSGMTTHVNKVHHVTTITQVAKDLGEDEDWLRDISIEMEIEDGVIRVYGVGEDGVKAFSDFGIENLIELSGCTRKVRDCLSCGYRKLNPSGHFGSNWLMLTADG